MENQKKIKVQIVFVILCYKETKDLLNLLANLHEIINSHRVIIVNSFYNEGTERAVRAIATDNGCDFLTVENKGYGAGNNVGISLALEKYDLQYICVLNPDVIFQDNKIELPTDTNCAVAPEIITLTGKRQNPHYPIESTLVNLFKHMGCKYHNIFLYFCAVLVNKINKKVFRLFKLKAGHAQHIYAAHGSCIFLGRKAIERVFPLYYEKMFLYNEEEHVARKLKAYSIPTWYFNKIRVQHKEGGSSSEIRKSKTILEILKDQRWFELTWQSYNVMYDYWKNQRKHRH